MPDFVVNDVKVLKLEKLLEESRQFIQTARATDAETAKKGLDLNRRIDSALRCIRNDVNYPSWVKMEKMGYE